MTCKTKSMTDVQPGEFFWTVQQGMAGFFACQMWINNECPDLGPFPEPYASDPSRFPSPAEAEQRAMIMAEAENEPYVTSSYV